jgi:poly(A) polymerase
LQQRFERRRGKRPLRLLSHPRFRAAYDFLLLRREGGEDVAELADWWTELLNSPEGERQRLTAPPPRRRKRRPSTA